MTFALAVWTALTLLVPQQTCSQPTSRPVDPEVEAILDRLEARGEEIDDLQAELSYTQHDLVVDDSLTKRGYIYFRKDEPNAKFAIIFVFGDGKREHYLFDGRWFTEVNERTKTYQRHEVVRPGESIDPFRIGGPFPLPFGQKKADILANFEVTEIPPAADSPNVVRLRCVPRPGTRLADQHNRVDFTIATSGANTDLPIRLVDDRKGQKRDVIEFGEIKLNQGLPGSLFERPKPKASEGWQVLEDDTLPPVEGTGGWELGIGVEWGRVCARRQVTKTSARPRFTPTSQAMEATACAALSTDYEACSTGCTIPSRYETKTADVSRRIRELDS